MLKKIFFTIVFLFVLVSNSVFADTLNYSIVTELPNTEPYYIGTLVKDLTIYFTNDANKVINEDLNYLNVKLGNLEYKFLKEKDYKYHLRNFYISEDHILNKRFSIEIKTPLEQSNIKKSYSTKDISKHLELKNNINNFSKLTVGEKLQLYLEFKSIKDISNLNCFVQYNNVKNNLSCERNICVVNFLVPDELNEINFVCNYEKTIDKVKSKYPFLVNVKPELSSGIYIKEITNPKNKVIKNPFEVCFNIYYKSNRPLKDYYDMTLYVNNVKTNFYDKENNYCFNKFLFPYTNLNLDLTLTYDNSEYYFKYNEKLKPGLFWTLVFVFVILFVIINIVFIIHSIVSKEDLDSLIAKRDSYQTRLVLIKEKYLQGNIDKKEFEKDLQEYSIKISWLNEQILRLKKQNKSKAPKFLPKNMVNKKAPKELLNVLNDSESIKDKDTVTKDTVTKETISKDTIKEDEFEKNTFFVEDDKDSKVKESKIKFTEKIKTWLANLKNKFKRKPKNKPKDPFENNKDLESIFASPLEFKELKDDFEDKISLDSEFDIRKWQK